MFALVISLSPNPRLQRTRSASLRSPLSRKPLGFEANERRLTMRTFAQKPKATQQTTSAKSTIPGRAHFGQSREVNSILHLQRTIGNQAVQRVL